MNKNLLKAIFILLTLAIVLEVVFAESSYEAYNENTIARRINCVLCRVMSIFFNTLAAIAGLMIVVAGIRWIGSADDPGGRASARITIVHVLIGLLIVMISLNLVAWLASDFIPVPPDFLNWTMGSCDICR